MEPPTESPGEGAQNVPEAETEAEVVEADTIGNNSETKEEGGKAHTDTEAASSSAEEYFDDGEKPAPQAQENAPVPDRQESSVDSVGELVDCKLSPLDIKNQRQNLKDVLFNKATPPPLHEENSNDNNNNGNGGGNQNHVQFANDQNQSSLHQHQSSLHQDEYSQYDNSPSQRHNPHNHESALAPANPFSDNRGTTNHTHNNTFQARKKNRLVPATGGSKKGHSHPRKSPYRSEVARLRHAQKLEREKQQFSKDPPPEADDGSASTSKSAPSIKDTTAPPETAFFSIQSSKFKHALLHSLGEFLTSAFADDEESSGSYFSQDLLDQLSNSNPYLKGVWLQAKNLNDDHVKDLCHALIRNKVVTEVWLPSNQITDVGAAYIAHMLKFNRSIKELFLGECDIGPKGAAALASALARGNATLVALGLGDNHIGVEGAGAFAAALRHNHSLHTLDIKNNGIPKKSSIRALLNKMLEFNASDPGDESLVLGLQEELANLVSNLPPDLAEHVVLQAEEALKTAMLCRKRGDKVGAAEAEGIFIRICTTGEPPVDPPDTEAEAEESRAADVNVEPARISSQVYVGAKKGRPKKPMEPDRLDGLNDELSTLQFNSDGGEGEEEGVGPASQEESGLEEGGRYGDDETAAAGPGDEQPEQSEAGESKGGKNGDDEKKSVDAPEDVGEKK